MEHLQSEEPFPQIRILEQFFLTVGQNNFGNKIPFLDDVFSHFYSIQKYVLNDSFLFWRKVINMNTE